MKTENKNYKIEYDNTIFKNNLKYLISKNNITQKELEKKLEIADGLISRYINNKNTSVEPKMGILNSIAKYFDVKIDDLINKDLKNSAILSVKDSSDILFLEKIVKETIEGIIIWEELDFHNHHYIKSSYSDYGEFNYGNNFESNFLETFDSFKSSFSDIEYPLNDIHGYTCLINLDKNISVQLIIIRYLDEQIDDNFNFIYEFYMVNNNRKVIPCFCSHNFYFLCHICNINETLYELLNKLYDMAPNSEKEKIFISYINKKNF